jgi:hypothetical membrane protein
LQRQAVTIPTGLLGIGVLGVGIFPGNNHPWHPIFAYTAFLAGGLAVLLSYRVSPQPLRVIFAILGALSLLFTVPGVFLPEWGPFARLELGEVERWMVYPVVLWPASWASRSASAYARMRRTACGESGPARGRRQRQAPGSV